MMPGRRGCDAAAPFILSVAYDQPVRDKTVGLRVMERDRRERRVGPRTGADELEPLLYFDDHSA